MMEFEEIATTPSPFCSIHRESSIRTQKKKNSMFNIFNCVTNPHIETCKLGNILLQVLNKWAMVANEHHLERERERRKRISVNLGREL